MADKPGVASSFPDHCFDNDGNLDLEGSANVYTAKTARRIQGNFKGLRICGRVPVTNTGASTLKVDEAPAIAIKDGAGSDPAAGDLVAGTYFDFIYDDANDVFQFAGPTTGPGFSPVAGPGISISGSTISGRLSRRAIADITSGDTAAASDRASILDIASGTGTLAFDPVATLGNGWFAYIRNRGTGIVTLNPSGAETIDGLASWELYPGGAILVQCDGSDLRTILLCPMRALYTANGTFVRPGSGTEAFIQVWGGGGSGGKSGNDGGGGGGGGYNELRISLSSLSASIAVTIGAGAAAVTTASTNGNVGGQTSFGAYLSGFGGGGGSGVGITAGQGGGGGGGMASAGITGTNATGGAGGGPGGGAASANATLGGGGGGSANTDGGSSVYGGGGGGGGEAAGTGRPGGASLNGGGGGGGGGDTTAGAGGVSTNGGNGGAGGIAAASGTAGTAPGGGGGGTDTGATTGAGARGEVRITIH